MSINLPTFYVQQFANNVQLLLQQKGSRLRMACTEGTYVGKQASPVEQIGAISMQPVIGRFEPKGRVDAPMDRRWVFPNDYDLNQLIDKFDKLRLLIDPSSAYVQNAVNAAGRQIDDIIIAQMLGDNKTGETAGTTTSFLAGNIIAENFGASGDVGLTVHKLREAKRLLMSYEVEPDDPIFAALNATAHDGLLAEAQVISTDFNDKPVLVEGKVERFLGVNFIHTERVTLTDTDDRQIPVWAKSGVHVGLWEDQIVDIDQRKDLKSHPWQAYLTLSAGATRLEEKKVISILCEE